MKRLSKIITGVITSSFLIGGFSAFLAHEYKQDIKVSEAAANNDTTGAYKRISDVSELHAGDTVLLVYREQKDYAIKQVEPYYSGNKALGLENIENSRGLFGSYMAIQSSYAEEFYVENGTASGSFAFKGLAAFNNEYIAHLGGYGIGSSSSKNASTSWYLEYFSDYDGEYHFGIKNVESSGSYLWYNPNVGLIGFNSNAHAEFNIYVKQNVTHINLFRDPNQTTYYPYESINLAGMKVEVMINSVMGDSFDIAYDKCPAVFQKQTNSLYESDYVFVTVFYSSSYAKNVYFYANVVENPNYTYTRVTNATKDFRGTYVFAYVDADDQSKNAIFNSRLTDDAIYEDGNLSRGTFTASGNKISGLTYAQTQMTMEIGRFDQDGESIYYMKTAAGQYLTFEWNMLADYQEGFKVVDTLEEIKQGSSYRKGEFCTNDGDITLCSPSVSMVFYLWNTSSASFSFVEAGSSITGYEYYKPAYLYKLDTQSDTQNEVNSFVSGFNSNIKSQCDATGLTNNITSAMWTAQKNAFLALSVDAQGILANVTYNHGSEIDGSMKDIIDLYDYIVSKYGYEDFMNRGDAGTMEDNSSNSINPVIPNILQNNAVIIIVVTSIAAVSSLAITYLLKKRKR